MGLWWRRALHPVAWIGLTTLAACTRRETTVLMDLAAELPVAELEGPVSLVRFGFPAADTAAARGLFRGAGPDGDRLAWARREAVIEFPLATPSPREALLDVAPYPGLAGQRLEVLLNDHAVTSLTLESRARHRFPLPAASQFAGRNVLTLRFGRAATRWNPQGRRLAGSVHSLVVAPERYPLLDALAAPGAPELAEARGAGPTAILLQACGTQLHYALPAAGPQALRFRLERQPGPRPDAVRASVRFASGLGEERELWSGSLDTRQEQLVALPERSGAARLTLAVEAAGGAAGAWAAWRAPRVVGGRPPVAREDSRVARLRRELRGANVVLVVLDAAAAGHFSAYGYPRATTPEIDRLAREGVLFRSAYTTAPYTIGAVSSLWTSRHPDELSSRAANARLAGEHPTLAELLAARGVVTAGFVANSFAGTAFALDRGFAEFHEELGADARSLRETVAAWLAAQAGRRFFLYVHFREPHFPYDPPPPFDARFGSGGPLTREARTELAWIVAVNDGSVRPSAGEIEHLLRLYDANLAFADQQVGALRRALEASGLLERTLLVVTADHGEALYEHGFVGHNLPLHEESLAVPLVLRLPGPRAPRGLRVSGLVDLLDLAPTVADAMGVRDDPRAVAFRGRSLLPLVFDAPGKPLSFARNVVPQRPGYAIHDGRYSWMRDTATGREQLFDLASDPAARQDLAPRLPFEALLMRQELYRFLAGLNEPREAAEPVALTPEQRENLRALGYVE
jgi:arylsulfatase